jgi:hypothetical protein
MSDASLTRQDAKVGVIREKEETHEGISLGGSNFAGISF